MEPVNNNQFEIIPSQKTKRKIVPPSATAYLNPALDILANEDPMCNTAMEIVPVKKRKHTKSTDLAAFENTALDVGISKAAVNEFLVKELENVRKSIRTHDKDAPSGVAIKEIIPITTKEIIPPIINCPTNILHENKGLDDPDFEDTTCVSEPIYANLNDLNVIAENDDGAINTEHNTLDATNGTETNESLTNLEGGESVIDLEADSGISVLEQKSLSAVNAVGVFETGDLSNINHTNITNNIFINNQTNLSLSFIDRLALDSPNMSNQSLYLDDDLNESNIMEIKTITIITKKKRVVHEKKKSTNPFLNQSLDDAVNVVALTGVNPFLNINTEANQSEIEYNSEQACLTQVNHDSAPIMPRRLFASDTNSTISTMNESESNTSQHEYENVDDYRSESPIYENIGEANNFNKQSKILGHDVRKFSAIDIMNLNKNSQANSSNESNDSKKDHKHSFFKAGNKLSKKVFKTLKKTFKGDKPAHNVTLNPYEVPRKVPKVKTEDKEAGIENPALNIDNSDEIEIEELDDDEEHQYETIKTLRNTRLNMNVTPLKERCNEIVDTSQNKSNTPGKKVRFDSTLNQEKVITGNSFDYGVQSPGFDVKIDKYHDELENCMNERKFIQQNM
ncbi:hypothetical protein JYU34_011812 [Plutella xylostella]|uniref:Uncharacterized protein n=1 Tax=Plutella xylostella TaxID=51655 RepID=A0ABQ7QDM6_PLUXY|nr:hypothetical protein JYU34_011812 [Plutella xylostella]